MVYRGKPSAKCGRCRSRSLKCGEERPSCSQCVRARVNCSGYRDLDSLLFLDESENVGRKARKTYATKAIVDKQGPSYDRRSQDSDFAASTCLNPEHILDIALRDQALSFVYRNYLQTLVWIHGTDTSVRGENTAMTSAIAALGLSAMANIRMNPTLMLEARKEYIKALSATNQSIMDPVMSKTDETLVAVMFLAMFEVVTFTDAASIQRWMNHIQGAAKLLEWRGEQQLRSPRGLHLFRLIRNQVITQSIFRESCVSTTLLALCREAAIIADPISCHADKLATMTIELSSFCADVRNGKIESADAKIGLALRLDSEMEAWAASVPSELAYTIYAVPSEDQSQMNPLYGFFGKSYHAYNDLWSCALWNNWRAARIIIQEIILNSCNLEIETDPNPGFDAGSSRLVTLAKSIMTSMMEDICASVPYNFGIAATPTATEPEDIMGVGVAAGHLLLWPLFQAVDCLIAPVKTKEWGVMCLDKIGHSMGINQALGMAQLLREGRGIRILLNSRTENSLS